MRAVITVLGEDRVGIIAEVSGLLAKFNTNILDITQTIMQDIFTMVMLVDISGAAARFDDLSNSLDKAGEKLGVKVRIQREDIFRSMHRI